MSEPVHIDVAQAASEAGHNTSTNPLLSVIHLAQAEAYGAVRSGEIVTDADVKVDDLYRALARIGMPAGRPCAVCGGHAHYADANCLFMEAVEYVNNNPKEDR